MLTAAFKEQFVSGILVNTTNTQFYPNFTGEDTDFLKVLM